MPLSHLEAYNAYAYVNIKIQVSSIRVHLQLNPFHNLMVPHIHARASNMLWQIYTVNIQIIWNTIWDEQNIFPRYYYICPSTIQE